MIELIVVGLPVVVFLLLGIRIVRPVERGVIERLGKYRKIAEPGFSWIIPIVDTMVRINTTEQMVDVEPQEIITKDNLNARVDLQVYYKVRIDEDNLKKSLYRVDDFVTQVTALAQTTARAVIGDLNFVQVNSERNKLNEELRGIIDKESDEWGVEVVRVEMKEITPPKDVQNSMNHIIKAENEKKAAKDIAEAAETTADGEKRAQIKVAEGSRQGAILKAEGQANAILKVAAAESEQIRLINQSIQKNFKNEAQVYKQLETTEKALQHGSKYVIDSKSNIMNVMSEAAGTPIPIKR